MKVGMAKSATGNADAVQEITALSRMTLAELRDKYLHAFGDVT